MEPGSRSHDEDQRQGILQGALGMAHVNRECSGRVLNVVHHQGDSQIGVWETLLRL